MYTAWLRTFIDDHCQPTKFSQNWLIIVWKVTNQIAGTYLNLPKLCLNANILTGVIFYGNHLTTTDCSNLFKYIKTAEFRT